MKIVLARALIYLPSTIYRTLELSYGIFGRYMVTERFVGGSSGPRFCTHWLMVTCSCDGCRNDGGSDGSMESRASSAIYEATR